MATKTQYMGMAKALREAYGEAKARDSEAASYWYIDVSGMLDRLEAAYGLFSITDYDALMHQLRNL